jgi:hypothetical protein
MLKLKVNSVASSVFNEAGELVGPAGVIPQRSAIFAFTSILSDSPPFEAAFAAGANAQANAIIPAKAVWCRKVIVPQKSPDDTNLLGSVTFGNFRKAEPSTRSRK